MLELCRGAGSAPARDGWTHAWAVTTCRQRLARAHIVGGRPHAALEEISVALGSAPDGYGVHALHTLAAEAHLEAGEHAEAQAALSRALTAHPHHVPAHLAFSRMLQANVSWGGGVMLIVMNMVMIMVSMPIVNMLMNMTTARDKDVY